MGTRFLLLISLIFLVFYTSCTSSHNIPYFQNNSNANSINNQQPIYNQQLESIEAPFQKNDILDITISSRSKEASADFNKPELVVEGPKGYLINSEGNIELPMLGKDRKSVV